MNNKNYKIRSDLAIQNKNLKLKNHKKVNSIEVNYYYNNKENYTNILFKTLETKEHMRILSDNLAIEIKKYLKKYQMKKEDSCLIVGLGNKDIVSDSLGVLSANNVIATAYLKKLNISKKYRDTYVYNTGIIKNTGIIPYNNIKALVREIKPKFIIIIDALISGSIEYLNKVIQISDKGITPGSGVSNYGEEISYKTLKIPVIVIGVPTAIEASTIIRDVLNIDNDDVPFKEGYDLIVSSKDIDIFINYISKVIGEGINIALNNINSF